MRASDGRFGAAHIAERQCIVHAVRGDPREHAVRGDRQRIQAAPRRIRRMAGGRRRPNSETSALRDTSRTPSANHPDGAQWSNP